MILANSALAKNNVVPANPTTRDAVQVPPSFLSYERRTGLTEYAAGGGFSLGTWLAGATLHYDQADKAEDQLVHARGPADAIQFQLSLVNGGNLFSKVNISELCARQGLKADDCVFSNLDGELQDTYRDKGPDWDAPVLVLLSMGGSYQSLTMRDPADRTREQGQGLWGARARLGIGGYFDKAMLGPSAGLATVGAPPSQVSYCTSLGAAGTESSCTPAYLESYNRTTILDVRLEWRQTLDSVGFNPALQAILQRSERDDVATANDDAKFGLRYVDLDLPIYIYLHASGDSGFYAGLRWMLRWWYVDRSEQFELMGGFFASLVYGGAGRHQRTYKREFFDDNDG
jgi:hypothetical protein